MKRSRVTACALAAALSISVAACSSTTAAPGATAGTPGATSGAPTWKGAGKSASSLKFGTVVKSMGFNWFKRMEVGVKKFGQDTGISAFEQGPSEADPAQENQVAQDMLAQNPDALIIDPIEVSTAESVMKQAMSQGVPVVALESPGVKNAVYDVEPFDNKAYGEHMMDGLAKSMSEKGKYGMFVGALNSQSQMEWTNAAIAHQKQKYPNMQMVGDINVTGSDQSKSYAEMKQLMQKYPDLGGVLGADAYDVVGAGQAVQEAGLTGKIAVMGTSIVSYAGDLLKSGAITQISTWDPADHGYVGNKVAQFVLQGKQITTGTDLGVPGYTNVTLNGKTIYGSGWVDITKSNMGQYNF
ncbi:MAG: LacI family transcriptional regulator [Sphaerisporangium sp.]|jgi:simple sugar transport system substrate-binding protein|nr:LacI family transcriptional regulator [Sphaerisporangium sp.]